MPEPTTCRNATTCRHVVRPLESIAKDVEAAGRAASVALVGAAPNVEVMERELRERLCSKTRRLLAELEGSCFACALNRAPMLTEASVAGACPP